MIWIGLEVTFTCDLQLLSRSIPCTFILRCILCIWIFVPKIKFVGSAEFEIWTFVCRKLNCELDLWPKVTNFNMVRGSLVSNHLAKIASKSVQPFDWNFYQSKAGQTHIQTNRHTYKLQWKYNPSMIAWRCKKTKKNIS